MGADSSIVFVPMLIIGFGIGALASQLGNVTVSSVPTEKSSEVGGLQNTASQLGASIGTALAGSILIAALTASFLAGIEANPNVPQQMKDQANTSLAAGAPFISDSEAQAQLEEAGVPADVQDDILTTYEDSQIDGLRTALSILAVMGVIALFFTGRIPKKQPGSSLLRPGPAPIRRENRLRPDRRGRPPASRCRRAEWRRAAWRRHDAMGDATMASRRRHRPCGPARPASRPCCGDPRSPSG